MASYVYTLGPTGLRTRVIEAGGTVRAFDYDELYRLKARVDIADNNSGVVRAKAWKKGEPEPEKWTIEVPHKTAHQNGSPGLFGFSPQDMRVFIDNVTVVPN